MKAMKLHAIILALAVAVTVPGVAGDLTNLCRISTATAGGWHAIEPQGSPDGIRDGSALWSGSYYGSTANMADGYYYIYWGQDAQTVQTVRWMKSLVDSSRTITSFTLWSLNANANPALDSSWTSLGVYTVPAGEPFCQIVLPKAVTTQGIKLSYTDQVKPPPAKAGGLDCD